DDVARSRRADGIDSDAGQLPDARVPGDEADVAAAGSDVASHLGPAIGRPTLRRAVALGDEQDGVTDLPPLPLRDERLRTREVRRDPEVGAEAGEDLVDRERPDGLVELGRSPPVVPLQRVIAQVDEAAAGPGGVERLLVHAAAEADATGERG